MSKVRKIIVGVDGSESSLTALLWALGEARLRNTEVEVIHSWSLTPMVDPMGFASFVPIEELSAAATNVVDGMMKKSCRVRWSNKSNDENCERSGGGDID